MHTFVRRSDVFSQPVGDETLVFDPRVNQLHRLNRMAAQVWAATGDHTNAATMASALRDPSGAPYDETLVQLALLDLETAGLIEAAPEGEPHLSEGEPHLSRRELLILIGQRALAAGLLPFIASLDANASPKNASTRHAPPPPQPAAKGDG